jgi:hypothetical protein
MSWLGWNVGYRIYSSEHDRTTPPLLRHHHYGRDGGHLPNLARVRGVGICEANQHRERAHGPDSVVTIQGAYQFAAAAVVSLPLIVGPRE